MGDTEEHGERTSDWAVLLGENVAEYSMRLFAGIGFSGGLDWGVG